MIDDTDERTMSGPNLIPLGLRNIGRDSSGSGSSSAWPKTVAATAVSSSSLPLSHARLIGGAGSDEDRNDLHLSGPLTVRGPTEQDWNTAVPVYGVNQGNASLTPPSLSSSSSSSATSASDLLRDSYPLPTAASISSNTTSSFFSSFPSSSYRSSNSIINYTAESRPPAHSNSNSNGNNSSAAVQYKLSTLPPSSPSSFSRNNYVNVNPAILMNRRISSSNINNSDNNNNHIQPHIQNYNYMSDYRANAVTNNTSNSTVYMQNDAIDATRADDVTANQPSAEGFLSKYVRDIGLRARSLVGGLLKRDETVQVCVCLFVYVYVCFCVSLCVEGDWKE